jgi:hypothetical protein
LPTLFFNGRPGALDRVQLRRVGGQPGHGQPLLVRADERAHQSRRDYDSTSLRLPPVAFYGPRSGQTTQQVTAHPGPVPAAVREVSLDLAKSLAT